MTEKMGTYFVPCPKHQTPRCQDYKDWLTTQPCCGPECKNLPGFGIDIVPAHQTLGIGGKAIKASDYWAVPLCTLCHDRQHLLGDDSFWEGTDVKMIVIDLHDLYFLDLQRRGKAPR